MIDFALKCFLWFMLIDVAVSAIIMLVLVVKEYLRDRK